MAESAQSFADLSTKMRAFQESRTLLTAVELNTFTAVGTGSTAAQVASRLGANVRSTETFLNALVALGALAKRDHVYLNTPETARYLVEGSPDYARPALMHTVHMWRAWDTLTDAVRKGTAVRRPGIEEHDPKWTDAFISAMHRNAATAAAQLVRTVGAGGVRRLLDVGGGSGAYSIAFAQAGQDLHAVVLDLQSVVPIAQKHIEEAGLAGRVTTRVGDLRKDDFGEGYDLILLSAICHMLGPEENLDLFRRCRRALAPGGRLVIRDFILDADKTAPPSAALFALNMLVGTENGSTYNEKEYRDWLASAGFGSVDRPGSAGDLLIGTRQ
jgi:SAM-dependent methyltransferase